MVNPSCANITLCSLPAISLAFSGLSKKPTIEKLTVLPSGQVKSITLPKSRSLLSFNTEDTAISLAALGYFPSANEAK